MMIRIMKRLLSFNGLSEVVLRDLRNSCRKSQKRLTIDFFNHITRVAISPRFKIYSIHQSIFSDSYSTLKLPPVGNSIYKHDSDEQDRKDWNIR